MLITLYYLDSWSSRTLRLRIVSNIVLESPIIFTLFMDPSMEEVMPTLR
jgi:hypothetical protein